MKNVIAIFSILVTTFSFSNDLVLKYHSSVIELKTKTTSIYQKTDLSTSSEQALKDISLLKNTFDEYISAAQAIRARFKQQDIQLFADLQAMDATYCSLDTERDDNWWILGLTNPALAPLGLLGDERVVLQLSNYSDLESIAQQFAREEFKLKTNKYKPKRYLRKLKRLVDELNFED